MDATTLKALKQSIAHWRRMATGKARKNEEPSSSSCALCEMFNIAGECFGCPVYDFTRTRLCNDTPYAIAHAAFKLRGLKSKEFKTAAAKELAFLESLLPKPKRKTKKP